MDDDPGGSALETRRGAARLWEIDALRTLAIGMMVTYHVAYDIDLLAVDAGIDPFNGAWRALQVATGSSFLTLVGVSYWIAHQRGRRRGVSGVVLWRSRAHRAQQVLAGALLVTLATLLAVGPEEYVRFGILHLIGTTMLVVLPLAIRLGLWNVMTGLLVIVIGLLVREVQSDLPGALVLGFEPDESGVDWYPMFPWSGFCLLGLAIGAWLYPDGQRRPVLERKLSAEPRVAELVGAPGRHSLRFYLVHQPVLIAVIAAGLGVLGAEIDWL